MVCANVQDGFDLYNVHTREHLRTFVKHAPEGANVSLPALFIHDDQDILLGSSGGPISIVKAADGTEVETLKDRGTQVCNAISILQRPHITFVHPIQVSTMRTLFKQWCVASLSLTIL